MTTATESRHRTRKNPLNGTFDVQLQSITRNWHHIGRVWPFRQPYTSPIPLSPSWDASHRGVSLGFFPTKREAVQAVVDAEERLG